MSNEAKTSELEFRKHFADHAKIDERTIETPSPVKRS